MTVYFTDATASLLPGRMKPVAATSKETFYLGLNVMTSCFIIWMISSTTTMTTTLSPFCYLDQQSTRKAIRQWIFRSSCPRLGTGVSNPSILICVVV